jgi:hypothetical protein
MSASHDDLPLTSNVLVNKFVNVLFSNIFIYIYIYIYKYSSTLAGFEEELSTKVIFI